MNSLLNNLIDDTNFDRTENGAFTHSTTRSAVLDLFGLGAAFRQRSDEDCILLFKNAYEENPELALKTLFYISDVRGGQGERRFFRVCYRWLCENDYRTAIINIKYIPVFRRWDDVLYATYGTKAFDDALEFIGHQLQLDVESKTPSLLGKWLPSENASSAETKKMGNRVRNYFGYTHKEYRQILSELRARINIVERLMSEGKWDQIKFDKIPSKAGMIYRNAFAHHDMNKRYEEFAKNKITKVNAAALYPYEIVRKARKHFGENDETIINMIDKYWENQTDVLEGQPCKMLCMVDTSGSMTWNREGGALPIDVGIGLGIYCAERVGEPFKNYYISFSRCPQLVKVEGINFIDKVNRIYRNFLCENTNLLAAFDLVKDATKNAKPEDRLDTIVVISDMEIDEGTTERYSNEKLLTEMENVRAEWAADGLVLPKLVYWNVNARNNRFLDLGPGVSYVSGASPMLFKMVATGKSGWDLFLATVVENERYADIHKA